MYNLTVDTAHTFYVGEGQWLVHNSCNPTKVPARDLFFSQKGISPVTKDGIPLEELQRSISQGWKGAPLNVLEIGDRLVSLDNRRLAVAKILNIDVPVSIKRGFTESDLITKFKRDGIFKEIFVRGRGKIIDMFGNVR